MYRINLYPDYGQSRRRQHRRTALTAGLMFMLGLEIVMVGALVLSGNLLGERARDLSADMPAFLANIQEQTRQNPEMELVRSLLELRQNRIDWTPMMAALAESCGPDMVLYEISGRSHDENDLPLLSISGLVEKEQTSLETVSSFLERIRDDDRIADSFEEIEVGNIRGGGSGEFDVICAGKGVRE